MIDYERERRRVSDDAIVSIKFALEKAGIKFINGNQPGVRLIIG